MFEWFKQASKPKINDFWQPIKTGIGLGVNDIFKPKPLGGYLSEQELTQQMPEAQKTIGEFNVNTGQSKMISPWEFSRATGAPAPLIPTANAAELSESIQPTVKSPKITYPPDLTKVNKRIVDDGRWTDLILNNGAESVSPRLLSALIMTENRGGLNPEAVNYNKKANNYDVGLLQHNSPELVDKNIPVDKRVYKGTQYEMNKLFKKEYGRNYDVYNPIDNIQATVLFLQNLIKRTPGNLRDVVGSYNRGVAGHKQWANEDYINTFMKYYNEL